MPPITSTTRSIAGSVDDGVRVAGEHALGQRPRPRSRLRLRTATAPISSRMPVRASITVACALRRAARARHRRCRSRAGRCGSCGSPSLAVGSHLGRLRTAAAHARNLVRSAAGRARSDGVTRAALDEADAGDPDADDEPDDRVVPHVGDGTSVRLQRRSPERWSDRRRCDPAPSAQRSSCCGGPRRRRRRTARGRARRPRVASPGRRSRGSRSTLA